jgi:hypothetical protein
MTTHPLALVLALASEAVRKSGYHKSAEGPEATAHAVRLALAAAVDPFESDVETARAALAFIRSEAFEGSTSYVTTSKDIARADACTDREIGFVVSWIPVHARHVESEAARANALPSSYVGTEGERLEMTLDVRDARRVETDYGTTTIVRYTDAAGNDLLWFGRLTSYDPLQLVGSSVHVRATVKRHEIDRYTGRPTTVLARVALSTPKAPKVRRGKRAA